MAFDYTGLVDDIDVLIEDMGRTVTLSIRSETPTDSDKPWRGTSAPPTTTSVKAVQYDFENDNVDGTIVRRGDTRFVFAAKDITSFNTKNMDKITVGSVVWGVLGVEEINPGGSAIAFVAHARR